MTNTSTSVNVPVNNPYYNTTSTGAAIINQPMLSQYMETDYSIFGNPVFTNPIGNVSPFSMSSMTGTGMYGMFGNSQSVDNYIDSYKKWVEGQGEIQRTQAKQGTQTFFSQQGNEFVQTSGDNEYTQKLTRLKQYIENNDMRTASELYDEIYQIMSKEVAQEMNENSDRKVDESMIRERIFESYTSVNGTDMIADIEANGDNAFEKGWKYAYGNGQNSASDMVSYVTGDIKSESSWEKFCKDAGHFFGDVLFGFFEDDGKADTKHVTSY